MNRVAILIVTYNSAEEIGGCIGAALAFTDAEIVVIDNASADSTREIVTDIAEQYSGRAIRLICNPKNAGFAAAVNAGVRATSVELLLLLNPDAHLLTGISPLTIAFDNPTVGAAGGLLVGLDGLPQTGFTIRRLPGPVALSFEVLGINRLFPGNPVNWRYRCYDLDLTRETDVEQPPGAFLMFRREAWVAAGNFDESFWPIWFEDVDFCANVIARGFRITFVPQTVARHTGAHSIQGLAVENRERYWYGSLLKYAAKHYRSIVFRAVCAAVAMGSVFRVLRDLTRQGQGSFAVHSAVFRLALGRLFGSVR